MNPFQEHASTLTPGGSFVIRREARYEQADSKMKPTHTGWTRMWKENSCEAFNAASESFTVQSCMYFQARSILDSSYVYV